MEKKELPETQSQVKFAYEGSTVNVYKFNEKTSSDKLIPQVYSLQKSMFGYFLSIKTNRFDVPSSVYGEIQKRANKILTTTVDRKKGTGILFTGDKGSGKTMLMNIVCNKAMSELELPVILVEFAASGPGFVDFIETLGACVLVFDEFGKMYNNSDNNQDDLLSLLDGTGISKRLVMMTENDEKEISSFLKGRPGRIYYHFKYGKLEPEIIREVCEEHAIAEKDIKTILDVSRSARVFSFDILNAIIEENKRYGEDILDTIKDLNIGVDEDIEVRMEIVKIIHVETGEELGLFSAYKYFNKPSRYNSSSVQFLKPAKDLAIAKERIGEKYSDFEYGRSAISVEEDELKAEEKGVCVYSCKNDEYIITAKYAPIDSTKYASYL